MRGAEVTLIHGQTALPPVKFTTDVPVTTARQMYEAVTSRFDTTDVLIMAAAVADYRPATVANDKIKKKEGDLSIPVERTEDILGTIGPRKTHQFLCGFSMETRDLVETLPRSLPRKIWTWWWQTTSRWPVQALEWIPTWSPSSPRTAHGSCL